MSYLPSVGLPGAGSGVGYGVPGTITTGYPTTTYGTGPIISGGSGVRLATPAYGLPTTYGTGPIISGGSGVRLPARGAVIGGAPIITGGAPIITGGAPILGGGSRIISGPTIVGGPTVVGGPTLVGGPTTYLGGTTLVGGPTTYLGGATTFGSQTVVGQRAVAQQIPVQSRIQYIPFQTKHIEYDQIERVQRIPIQRQITEYQQIVRTERVPIERTITDYYAVQTQIQYIPKQIQQTVIDYEPVERTWERVQYLPVETQIVHYPEREKRVVAQGQYIQASQAVVTPAYTVVPTASYAQYTTTQVAQVAPATVTYAQPATVTYAQPATVTYAQPAYTTSVLPATYTSSYQPGIVTSGVRAPVGQSFVSGASGTGPNYVYTSGGPLETSTFTTGGYAQPLSTAGYVTKDGTHLSSTGQVLSGPAQGKNQSFATNV